MDHSTIRTFSRPRATLCSKNTRKNGVDMLGMVAKVKFCANVVFGQGRADIGIAQKLGQEISTCIEPVSS